MFDGGMVLQIFRSSQFIDGIYVMIYMIYSCESSSFILNVLFLSFLLLDRSDQKMCVGINQLVKRGTIWLLEKAELGITLVLKHADKDFHTYDKPSINALTCWYLNIDWNTLILRKMRM